VSIFDFSDGQAESQTPADRSPRKRKAVKAAIGFGGLASLAGIGSTLAANITLNQGGAVEFGQGVAQTVACDSDGFNLTPVSYYDSTNSIFRLDYLQVSGVNLTPLGDGYDTEDAGHNKVVYGTRQEAIAAHPGQYYDTGAHAWTNTCDQAVLDFKAYTNDPQYSKNTLDGYGEYNYLLNQNNYNVDFDKSGIRTISTPLFWSSTPQLAPSWSIDPANTNIALIFDAQSDTTNYGTNGTPDKHGHSYDVKESIAWTSPGDIGGTGFNSNSSFRITNWWGHYSQNHNVHWEDEDKANPRVNDDVTASGFRDPEAGAISKITVASAKYFESSHLSYGGNADTLGLRP
jgi:hypothetical protein